jgi:hypothetical protein
LDVIHKFAIQYSIVTPFSSMIVLVDDRQQQDLKNRSEQGGRFNREVETGRKRVSNQSLFSVEGVPEPEEWALIVVIALLMIGAYVRKHERVLTN